MRPAKLGCGHTLLVPEDKAIGEEVFCGACSAIRMIAGWEDPSADVMQTDATPSQRSYGCSFGCGNPYDYVFVSVVDGTTEFPCLPCFLKLAETILNAVMSDEGALMMEAVKDMLSVEQAPMRNPPRRRRGKEAPVNSDDPDLITAFDTRITPEELGDEFK